MILDSQISCTQMTLIVCSMLFVLQVQLTALAWQTINCLNCMGVVRNLRPLQCMHCVVYCNNCWGALGVTSIDILCELDFDTMLLTSDNEINILPQCAHTMQSSTPVHISPRRHFSNGAKQALSAHTLEAAHAGCPKFHSPEMH